MMKGCQISQTDGKMAFVIYFSIGTWWDSKKFIFPMRTNREFPQLQRDDQQCWSDLYPGSGALCLGFEELRKSI